MGTSDRAAAAVDAGHLDTENGEQRIHDTGNRRRIETVSRKGIFSEPRDANTRCARREGPDLQKRARQVLVCRAYDGRFHPKADTAGEPDIVRPEK